MILVEMLLMMILLLLVMVVVVMVVNGEITYISRMQCAANMLLDPSVNLFVGKLPH
jgi:hypothetical protein